MSPTMIVEVPVSFHRCDRGSRKELRSQAEAALPAGRVPRVARLMALALRFDRLLRAGEIADYAELARLGHVTRARVSQVMSLLQLAPDIQEAILFLPLTVRGRDPIRLAQLMPIARTLEWKRQRRMWRQLAG